MAKAGNRQYTEEWHEGRLNILLPLRHQRPLKVDFNVNQYGSCPLLISTSGPGAASCELRA
eukprot:1325134-Pleurochrysis_carterae.AAC.2